jgi:cytidine deaminase
MNEQNLINAATELVNKYSDDLRHTVASAVLTKTDKVICSMNFSHFTGGPCAEVAALARVVSEGEKPRVIVAVGNNQRGVLSPCGKCRQTIFDCYPDMLVILSNDGKVKSIKELLPDTYSWVEQQIVSQAE